MSYLPHALLAGLCVLGYLGLHHLGHNDGLFPLLDAQSKQGVHPVTFASNESLKGLCGVLAGFFYPTVDGTHPGLTLACYLFVGQGFALWMTVMLEGARQGNRMRPVYFTALFGSVMQVIGGAVMFPAWLLLHLLTSPTTKPTKQLLAVSPRTLAAAPFAILFGFIAPTVLMSLHSPSILSFQQRVNAILLWQPFPVWCGVLQMIISILIPEPRGISHTRLSAYVCGSIIAVAALVHISATTVALAPLVAPTVFNSTAGSQLTAALFSFPPQPFSQAQITSVAEGALWFIQYDYAVTSTAFLIWAFTMRSIAWKESSLDVWTRSVGSTIVKSVLLGPMAAGALLIWERDLAVEQGESGNIQTERKKKA